jgi:hypothetical protein
MIPERDAQWAEFDSLGEVEIRKRLGAQQYGEQRMKLAREWLAHHASLRSSDENAASLAEARAANELAKEANTLALQANSVAEISAASAALSVAKAKTSNIIAIVAAAAAIAAVVISMINIRHTDAQHGVTQKTKTEESQTH